MSQDVSEAMIASLWLEEPGPKPILVTIEANGLDAPIRVTDYPGPLAGDRVHQGIISNGETFLYAPFALSWSGAGRDEPSRDATITIMGYDGQVERAIDEVNGQPTATIQMIRLEDPDNPELAITRARVATLQTDGPKAQATIRPRDFSTEPACAARATPARTPCLF